MHIIMINKIFIIGPVYPKKSWEKPFYLYANSLSKILTKNNIPNTITLNTNEPQENDLSFIFHPYYSDNKKLKGYIIYINSESINIRKCILSEIKNPKIKMIWDFRNDNISTLQKITKTPIYFVPPLYHEFMEENFPKCPSSKSIDFLLYGKNNERRNKIFDTLSKKYNAIIFQTGNIDELYNMIKQTRIILIIHFYTDFSCIDFYRISFLLSNKIFFITEDTEDKKLRPILKDAIIFSKYENFIGNCEKYIKLSQEERDNISQSSYNYFTPFHISNADFYVNYFFT